MMMVKKNYFVLFALISLTLSIGIVPIFATHMGSHHDDDEQTGQHGMKNNMSGNHHHISYKGMCAPGFASLDGMCVLDDRCGPGIYPGKVCVMDGVMKPYLKPLHQKHAGISAGDIICAEERQVMFKPHNASPACINSDSVEKLKHRGWQTEKPDLPCTLGYMPVCGVDGISYGNMCALNVQHMVVKHNGECSELPSIKTTVLYVDSKLVDCVGVGPQQCMLVKEDLDSEWEMFYDSIEGFDYQEGTQYKLDVIITEIEDPPADGSSLKYVLVEEQIIPSNTVMKDVLFFTLQGNDAVGNIVGETFDAGPSMTYITASNNGDLVLATSSGSDTVFAFDNNGSEIDSIAVGKTPKGVKIHPDGDMAFVANEGSGTISVIDVTTWNVTKEIEVGKIPHNIRFDSKGDTAYVTLQGEDKIAVIDAATLEMIDSIPVEKLPHNLDISSDDNHLYVVNIGTSDVAVVNLKTKEIIKRIEVSAGHHGIDVSNDGQRIYVSGIGSDKVNVIDVKSLELIKQIEVGQGPHGIRASTDSSKVYVGVTGTNEILIIDANTIEIKDRIDVGKNPFWLAIPGNQ